MTRLTKTQVLSVIGVLITTIIWGGGFVITKNAVDLITPVYLMAIRFTIAGLGTAIVFLPRLKKIKKDAVLPGAVLGFWLAVSFITQTYGIKYTTASNNAFITTFYVVAVPFLNFLINRAKIRGINLCAALTALTGVALLSVNEDFRVNSGDALTLVCSVCYGVHIVYLGRYAEKHGTVTLSILQMLFAAAFCWIAAPILEGSYDFASLVTGAGLPLAGGILYLAFLSTMLGFLFQTAAQKNLPTPTVSVLLTLECVFGTIFSVIFLHDPINIKTTAGFALMFPAVVISIRFGERKN